MRSLLSVVLITSLEKKEVYANITPRIITPIMIITTFFIKATNKLG